MRWPGRSCSTRARGGTSSRIASRSSAPPGAASWSPTRSRSYPRPARSTAGCRHGASRAAQPPPEALEALRSYADLLAARGAIDFDDLVVRAGDLLETDPRVRLRWQARFAHVCVDEFQDVDAAQLRLVRLLAAPEDNLFVVGDDDQTIYAWRLADVRRILRFSVDYPAARRVMLATNYRCPPPVVEASARLVATNRERFAKPIRAPEAAGPAPGAIGGWDLSDGEWPGAMARFAAAEDRAGRTCCFLTRTRAELTPVMLALVRGRRAPRDLGRGTRRGVARRGAGRSRPTLG